MTTKRSRVFLWIGLTLFAISLVLFFVGIILSYCSFKATSSTLSPDDLIQFEYGFVIELFAYMLFGIPILLLELSGIRSVYRILKYRPRNAAKVCLLISAILSFFAFAFQALMFIGVLDFTQNNGSVKLQEALLLLTGLPIVIVSFVLGSFPIKRAD